MKLTKEEKDILDFSVNLNALGIPEIVKEKWKERGIFVAGAGK